MEKVSPFLDEHVDIAACERRYLDWHRIVLELCVRNDHDLTV